MTILDCSKLEIIKADKEILSSIEFDCGDEDLNEFLLEDSFSNIENSLSKIYPVYMMVLLLHFSHYLQIP